MEQADCMRSTLAIEEAAHQDNGERYTIKQLEKSRKSICRRASYKLNDQSRKDDVVTFEQLGVDRLFVDESHGLQEPVPLYAKMRNVAGIAQTDAQKSHPRCLRSAGIIDETDRRQRDVTFATGYARFRTA